MTATDLQLLSSNLQDSFLPIVTGCATFGATLALSTAAQKLVGVSTATNVLPTIYGALTVCVASLASEKSAILAHQWQYNPQAIRKDFDKFKTNLWATSSRNLKRRASTPRHVFDDDQDDARDLRSRNSGHSPWFQLNNIPMHEVRVCLLGLLAFKALGGRFWAISPSSYTHLGSFARWSIPCTENYANSSQRQMIEKMGRKWGCHTCGSRMMGPAASKRITRFVGDHMPPKSVAEQMNQSWMRRLGLLPRVNFRFYPQCVNCSNTQGSILSKATHQLKATGFFSGRHSSTVKAATLKEAGGGVMAHFHGWRFRVNHLTGGVLAGTTVMGATHREITQGNPKRLDRWQRKVEKTIQRFRN